MEVAILACCAALLLYHHVGYPVLLRLLASRIERRRRLSSEPGGRPFRPAVPIPSVALLIPAYNEERVIRRKIINCAELDFPPEKLTIVIALDGCKDDTETVLRNTLAQYPSCNARVVVIEPNIGKIGVLNQLVPEIQTDLVALSDASALLNSDAVWRAVAHFDDPHVGVVCGTYSLPEDAAPGERAYWDYQIRIKSDEALIATPMGAHGAFYVFRRAFWTPLEPDTINDDFVLPMRIISQGWKGIYDRQIVATELEATNSRQDFRRRIRIGAGNLQQALRLWRLANPRNSRLAFVFVSGKGLRSFVPFILSLAFAASVSLALSGGLAWQLLLAAELAAGALVFAGAVLPGRLPGICNSFSYLVQGHVASGVGALLLLSGHAKDVWQVSKARRSSVHPPSHKIPR
jgi:cellulose synthase/poly-beta-1,6-N-acetylglucosamine synthase-like glycosyltransferase